MSDQDVVYLNCSSDKVEADKTICVLERTRNKVEIAVRLPNLTTHGNDILQNIVNITDSEIALLARIYSELEITTRQLRELKNDLNVPPEFASDSEAAYEDREHAEVCRAHRILSSNRNVCKLVRANRSEMSPKALAFVNCLGNYQSSTDLGDCDKEDQGEFATSKSTVLPKGKSNLSSAVTTKTKRILKRYEPKVNKKSTENVKQLARNMCDDSNAAAELMKWSSHDQDSALRARGIQLQVEALIKKHLTEEKQIREDKDKAEAELLACLEEYDRDVGTLQAQLECETAEFEEEKRQMIILEENFKVQQVLYEQLMAEKLAEYQRELKEKMYIFVCNRAALRIQRYWRAYRERKLAKKKRKGRKGQGKAGSGGKSTKN